MAYLCKKYIKIKPANHKSQPTLQMELSDKPIVSILVAVYNVQAYLNQCLDSIESQTFDNWECILVDDGSTDNSGAICDEYARKDQRFRVIHCKNNGVSVARNISIQKARGKYICFCDSDDWMEAKMIETMYRLITEHSADVVQVGFWREFNGYNLEKHIVRNTIVFDRDTALIELVKDKIIPSYMWNKMFCHEIIGPDFPVGKTFEDIYTSIKWFSHINRMVCDPTLLYHYRMRRGSIIHSNPSEYRLHFIEATLYRIDEILKLGLNSFNSVDCDIYTIKAFISGAKVIARREKDKTKREQVIKDISKRLRNVKQHGIKTLGFKIWFRSFTLRNCPYCFSCLMRLVIKAKFRSRKLYD